MPEIRTSQTHPLYINSINVPGTNGQIGMTICPGKKGRSTLNDLIWDRNVEDDVGEIHSWGASSVITLMEEHELKMLEVDQLGKHVKRLGMNWYLCPIVDLEAPQEEFENIWLSVGKEIYRQLAEGKKIVVHCRGGLGRTGTIVARVLIDFGENSKKVIEHVREVREKAIQTQVQKDYVLDYRTQGRRYLPYFQASLLGGAIGDALGGGIEFDSWDTIRSRFGSSGIQDYIKAYGRIGAITDDTQMSLFTAEGLLRAKNESMTRGTAPNYIKQTHGSYLRWLYTQKYQPATSDVNVDLNGWLINVQDLHHNRAPGNTCLSALQSGRGGTSEQKLNNSKGCGGVMRVAPVGMFAQSHCEDIPPEKRLDLAFKLGCDLSAITHGHPSGYLAGGAFAQIIADILAGTDLKTAVERVILVLRETTDGDECAAILQRALSLSQNKNQIHGAESIAANLGEGWVAEEALAIGVYSVLVHPDNFEATICLAVNHSGDSDSTGSIAGNISGALLGMDEIPSRWLRDLEMRDIIQQVATDLYIGYSADDKWSTKYPE